MSQSTVKKILAAIDQYESDVPVFIADRISSDHEYTVQERNLLRKLDVRLLPACSLFFFMAYLSRGNIASAKAQGMPEMIHLTDNEYKNCLMIFFVSYCAFQVPSNLMAQKATPSFWFPSIMACWGVVMTCMGLIVDYRGLFWSRFFLGMFLAGLFPGICFYLSTWYNRAELQMRLAVFFAVGSAAASFEGALASCIVQMDNLGGLEGWRWIFVLEGCLSVIVGIFSYMFLTNHPKNAEFLTEEEKELLIVRIKQDEGWPCIDQQSKAQIMEYAAHELHRRTWHNVKSAFFDWQSYSHAIIYLSIHAVFYGITIQAPILIKDMGYTGTIAQLLPIPIHVTACIVAVILAVVSDKVGSRACMLIFTFFMMVAGYLLVLASKLRDTRHSVTYSALFVAAIGAYSAIPCSIAWLANNSMGANKRNVALALQIGLGNLSGIYISYLYDVDLYNEGIILLFLALAIIVTLINMMGYSKLNKRHKRIIMRTGFQPVQMEAMMKLGDQNPYFEYVY